MKRRIRLLITTILAVIMFVSALPGCGLFTKNYEKDIAQVVATINLGGKNEKTDEIYKSDLISGYLNYGYYYELYYGYSKQQTFNLILESLVQSRIYVKNAMNYFEENDGVVNSSKEVFDLERYLDEDEIADAKYETKLSINNYIKSLKEQEDAKLFDKYSETVRTVPTGAVNAEKEELSTQDKNDFAIEIGSLNGTAEEKSTHKAYNSFIKLLDNNGLLGKDYNGDVTKTDYYNKLLKANEESAVTEKYEDAIKQTAKDNLKFSDLLEKYEDMYNTQVLKYDGSSTSYSEGVTNNSAQSPLVYSPYSGYGYVYNLLLGVSDEQKDLISNIKETNIESYKEERNLILSGTTVKDLRTSWVLSGYDFDIDTYKFTGDYAFLEDSLPLQIESGSIVLLNEDEKEDDDFSPKYRVDQAKLISYSLDEFVKFMNLYVYGDETVGDTGSSDYLRSYDFDGVVENYNEKINELLFAFSTDPGSLNTFKGYDVAPAPSYGENEKYVTEFANAARDLLTMGGKSYVIVATDYGYHVLFFSETLNVDADYSDLVSYLNSINKVEEDEDFWSDKFDEIKDNFDDYENTDEYLYVLTSSMLDVDSQVSKVTSKLVDKYRYNTKYVNVYTDRFSDLLN